MLTAAMRAQLHGFPDSARCEYSLILNRKVAPGRQIVGSLYLVKRLRGITASGTLRCTSVRYPGLFLPQLSCSAILHSTYLGRPPNAAWILLSIATMPTLECSSSSCSIFAYLDTRSVDFFASSSHSTDVTSREMLCLPLSQRGIMSIILQAGEARPHQHHRV